MVGEGNGVGYGGRVSIRLTAMGNGRIEGNLKIPLHPESSKRIPLSM